MRASATIILFSFLALLAAATGAAGRPCADAVISDWSDGRIDRAYAPPCYPEAIDALPEDVRNYSNAVDDISRALRARIRAQTRNADDAGEPARGLSMHGPGRPGPEPGGGPVLPAAISDVTGSLPLPLVSGAALALLLGLVGSTSLLARRLRHRRC